VTLSDLLWDLGGAAVAIVLLILLIIGCERTFL
jgi:hypothetical protein